jgi:Tfp pilus assembly protein PilZ
MIHCYHCGRQLTGTQRRCPDCEPGQAAPGSRAPGKPPPSARSDARRRQLMDGLFRLVSDFNDEELALLVTALRRRQSRTNRAHQRTTCLIATDYISGNRAYQDYVRDISQGGVFIETAGRFAQGEPIVMTLWGVRNPIPVKINGTIVRAAPDGIGVQFGRLSIAQTNHLSEIITELQSG